MTAESILKEFRKRRKLLDDVNAHNADPRIRAFFKYCKSVPEIEEIIHNHFSRYPTYSLLEGTAIGKPPQAGSLEETVSIGLFLLSECNEGNSLKMLAKKHGIIGGMARGVAEDFVKGAMSQYIKNALDYLDDHISQLVEMQADPNVPDNEVTKKRKTANELLSKGRTLAQKGQYEDAMNNFEKALKLASNKSPVLLEMGIAHGMQGNREAEFDYYNKAIKHNPNSIQAYMQKAHVLQQDKKFEEAIACLKKGIDNDLEPEKAAVLWHNLGTVYIRVNDYKEALKCINRSLELHDNEHARIFRDTIEKEYERELDETDVQANGGAAKSERELCLDFIDFLVKKKGYNRSNMEYGKGAGKTRLELKIVDSVRKKQLAVVVFAMSEDASVFRSAFDIFHVYMDDKKYVNATFYLVLPDVDNLGEQFNIHEFYMTTGEISLISCKDFPQYVVFPYRDEKDNSRYVIALCKDKGTDIDIDGLVKHLNSICKSVVFIKDHAELIIADDLMYCPATHKKIKKQLNEDIVCNERVVFTDKQYGSDFAPIYVRNDDVCVVSYFGWGDTTKLSKNNGAIYFIAQLIAIMINSDVRHDENIGCIYDFNIAKYGVDKGMKKGEMCPACSKRMYLSGDSKKPLYNDLVAILSGLSKASVKGLDILSTGRKKASSVVERNNHAGGFYICDTETYRDTLGFKPYVEAVAKFLTHEKTELPLTLSVEGEWGSGKSSFMLQLQDAIKTICNERNDESSHVDSWLGKIVYNTKKWLSEKIRKAFPKDNCLIVKFEPWRHDKDDALWAAFALKFIGDIAKSVGWWNRVKANVKLWKQRYDYKKAWPDIIRFVFLCIVWVSVTVVIFKMLWEGVKVGTAGKIVLPKYIGSIVAVLISLWGALGKVKDFLSTPLSVDLKKYMKRPDYVSKVSFIDRFHEDFRKIVKAYAGDKRVFIFVEDLDRCKVPKSAELMESINLMFSKEPNLIFVMGMDREKVAAGLAVRHEKLLPYLSSEAEAEMEDGNCKRKWGMKYGYSFIEKFIQVPFLLPTPNIESIRRMLESLSGEMQSVEQLEEQKQDMESEIERQDIIVEDIDKRIEQAQKREVKEEKEFEEREVRMEMVQEKFEPQLKGGGDGSSFIDIVLMVSEALNHNPRRVKQFMNIFRLQATIAASLNKLKPDNPDGVEFEQLGKFVAVQFACPLFIKDIEAETEVFKDIVGIIERKEDISQSNKSKTIIHWCRDAKLKRLIVFGNDKDADIYSLKDVDVSSLLRIYGTIDSGYDDII